MKIIETIQNQLREALSLKERVFESLSSVQGADGNTLELSVVIPNREISIDGIIVKVTSTVDLMSSSIESAGEWTLIPRQYLNDLSSNLQKVVQRFQAIVQGYDQLNSNGGVKTIDRENIVIISANGQYTFNLNGELVHLDKEIEGCLVSFYTLRNALDDELVVELASTQKSFTDILEKVLKYQQEIHELVKKADTSVNTIGINEKSSKKNLEQIAALLKEVQGIQNTANDELGKISGFLADATAKMPEIQNIHTNATSLKKQIEEYQADFEKFQKSLDQRIQTYTKGNEELTTLVKSLKEQEQNIIELNDKATNMLNNVTVAGLAQGFGIRRDELVNELDAAQKLYFKALWALFFSSLAPLIYLVYRIVNDKPIEYMELSVFLLLLIPAALFIRFSGHRYNNLFRLREHYAHKYSIAVSVEGFRDQLEKGKEEIIAATFTQLSSSNPDNIIDNGKGGAEHPLPIWEKFLSLFDWGKK